MQRGDNPFFIDVKGGECRHKGIYVERETCRKHRSTKRTRCFHQSEKGSLLEITLSLMSRDGIDIMGRDLISHNLF
jgi:hypothetical protein